MNISRKKGTFLNIRGLRKNQTIKNYRPNRFKTFRNHDSGSLVSGGGETDFFFGGDFFLMGQTPSGQSSPDFVFEHFFPQDLFLGFDTIFFFVIKTFIKKNQNPSNILSDQHDYNNEKTFYHKPNLL